MEAFSAASDVTQRNVVWRKLFNYYNKEELWCWWGWKETVINNDIWAYHFRASCRCIKIYLKIILNNKCRVEDIIFLQKPLTLPALPLKLQYKPYHRRNQITLVQENSISIATYPNFYQYNVIIHYQWVLETLNVILVSLKALTRPQSR